MIFTSENIQTLHQIIARLGHAVIIHQNGHDLVLNHQQSLHTQTKLLQQTFNQ